MSSPRVIVQIAVAGAKIFGKALYAAGKQAAANAKYRPPGAVGGDAAGVGHATSGSLTDRLTREHMMTADEARLVLNVKREDAVEKIVQNYEHLFKMNSPPAPPAKPASGKQAPPVHSHYLQSKVVRAKERLEAELQAELAEQNAPPPPPPPEAPSTPSSS
ncbi:Pam16-domain-containing protein [Daedaleopsis nitida]|nr:Pam16-domain-containing protein [Daedaleopsis nitida]